jgi:polar amino acid transport system substrate-binding protein
MNRLMVIFIMLYAGALHGAARGEVVNVYTSARVAPLLLDDGRGIYADMVEYLNRQKLDNLSFKLIYLPRKRLQLQVESGGLDGIVIGMMPHWFDDVAQKKYLWTAPFALDRYVVVLPPGQAYSASVPGALSGRSLGMVLGYSYPDLDDWIRRQGLIRSDAISDEHNLEKLRLHRVDSVAAAESIVRYYMKVHALKGQFQLHELPSRQTERRFLVPHSKTAIYNKIAPVLRKLKDDPEWQRNAAKYE